MTKPPVIKAPGFAKMKITVAQVKVSNCDLDQPKILLNNFDEIPWIIDINSARIKTKMQLDVGNEPYLSTAQKPTYNIFRDMNFFQSDFWSCPDRQTDRPTDWQTDGKWCIWAHRAICTGGRKNGSKIDLIYAICGLKNDKKWINKNTSKYPTPLIPRFTCTWIKSWKDSVLLSITHLNINLDIIYM